MWEGIYMGQLDWEISVKDNLYIPDGCRDRERESVVRWERERTPPPISIV